jgi:hypothetical protein
MAPSNQERDLDPSSTSSVRQLLSDILGDYRAEWLDERLFKLFAEPAYLPEFQSRRPAFLIGGRGTGKTTVLRGMSYEGQALIRKSMPADPESWTYYGLYYRFNTNTVTAFEGDELNARDWQRHFSHYLNLVFLGLVFDFLSWYQTQTNSTLELPTRDLERVALSLNLPRPPNLHALGEALETQRIAFEAAINNIADGRPLPLSLQAAPLDLLAEALGKLPQFEKKSFYFLLDEFENLSDYQQTILNTLIKHKRPEYTFKIGVRELGWRVRATLNPHEQLRHPADYERIRIADRLNGASFTQFAQHVCNDRFRDVVPDKNSSLSVQHLLPGLSLEEEAKVLGVDEALSGLRASLDTASQQLYDELPTKWTPLRRYLLLKWIERKGLNPLTTLQSAPEQFPAWETRLNNYGYALLFAIRDGKPGVRKHYAGFETMLHLADGNIRYVLQLVHQSVLAHFKMGGGTGEPIPPETQTRAAIDVARNNLLDLEGIRLSGARLVRLLLGLGRLFQVLATKPLDHAPETNEFHLQDDSPRQTLEVETEVEAILCDAVMHQALVRFPGSKMTDESQTREFDYMIHPIYSPFFNISHRQKRRMPLSYTQIRGLLANPRETLRFILSSEVTSDRESLPDQMLLFEEYYA